MILNISAQQLLPCSMTVVMTDDTHLELLPLEVLQAALNRVSVVLSCVKTLPLPDSITFLSCTLTANMIWPK